MWFLGPIFWLFGLKMPKNEKIGKIFSWVLETYGMGYTFWPNYSMNECSGWQIWVKRRFFTRLTFHENGRFTDCAEIPGYFRLCWLIYRMFRNSWLFQFDFLGQFTECSEIPGYFSLTFLANLQNVQKFLAISVWLSWLIYRMCRNSWLFQFDFFG